MSFYNKISIILLIAAITIGYSMYEKKKLDDYFETSAEPILKKIPEVKGLKKFVSQSEFDFVKEVNSSNGMIVHFWGTWCAPCEYELPHFLKFSKKFEELNVKVILLAVKDDDIKIKKFMKRFGNLPKNVEIVHDLYGVTMPKFGVVKVPETFVFSNIGKSLIKFAGPQDWEREYYFKRTINNLQLSLK